MAEPSAQSLIHEMNSLTTALRSLVNLSGQTANAVEANRRRTEDTNMELAEFSITLTKNNKLSKSQQVLADATVKAKKQELAAIRELTKAQERAAAAEAQYGAGSPEAKRANKNASLALGKLSEKQQKTAQSAQELDSTFRSAAKGATLAQGALVWFGSTVKAQITQLQAQHKANGGVIEGSNSLTEALLKQQRTAFNMGVTGEQLAQISAGARQTINALGGTESALQTLSPAVDRLRILTGSSEEGLRLAAEAAKEFAQKGVTPTTAGLARYTNDLVQLSRQTGMNTTQASEYYNEIANDVEMIDILRSARSGEREAILANQRAVVQQSIAMGMSATQAKEAAKMLNKMVAAKPLDRIRKAAKLRAIGGALGIAGSNEAADAMIAGKRATPEQLARLSKFETDVTNASDQAGRGPLGMEITTQALLDKLDNGGETYGKGSPFSTSLAESLKPSIDLQAQYLDASTKMDGKLLGEAEKRLKQLQQLTSGQSFYGVVLAGMAATVGAIFTLMSADKAGNAIRDALGGKNGSTSGKGGKLGKVAGMAGTATKVLGGLGAAGAGIYSGYEEYQKNGKVGAAVGQGTGAAVGGGLGGWGGAAAGAALGTAILPIGGTIIGGLIGGLAGGWLGGTAGGAAGKAVGSIADGPDSKTQASMSEAAKTTADGISTQLKQMDSQNGILTQLKEMLSNQTDIMKQQLDTMKLSDAQREAQAVASVPANKFSASYSYL